MRDGVGDGGFADGDPGFGPAADGEAFEDVVVVDGGAVGAAGGAGGAILDGVLPHVHALWWE